MEMPPLTIYHLEGRRSERIVWLMEELEMPYELEYVRGDLTASMATVRALGHEMPMVPTVTPAPRLQFPATVFGEPAVLCAVLRRSIAAAPASFSRS